MPLIEPIIRPPAEADSLLLQVTTGCSANDCTFCGAYRGKAFGLIDFDTIAADIEKAAKKYPGTRRVFLLDGDALVVNNQKLLPVLRKLNESFPHLTRIASYANGFNMTCRSDVDLKELYDNKLRLIYIGLESGDQKTLGRCNKKSTADEMVSAVRRSEDAGIKSSVIVLLGLGGKKHSDEHVKGTITALNNMQPRYLSFLSLMVIPETLLEDEIDRGIFEELNSKELLKEAHDIVSGLELEKTIFRSNHASNYLPLEGRFPKDKQALLDNLQKALAGRKFLRPEFLRGL